MEAYKSICPDCGKVYFWTGFKTGIGKTPDQLAQMKKDETICKYCGSPNLKTGLDMETETGKAYQESYAVAAQEIGQILTRMLARKE
jgi:hypothetical protein